MNLLKIFDEVKYLQNLTIAVRHDYQTMLRMR
jgi:hypothetical protein